jgi:hypothetical protein
VVGMARVFRSLLRKQVTVTAAVLVSAALGPVINAETSSAATGAARAMWVWKWDRNRDLVSFAQSHGVGRLFVWTWPGFSTSQPSRYSDLLNRASAAGIAVDALSGDPSWVNDPGQAVAWAREVVSFHSFAGLHLDVEPYALASWNTNQAQTITNYLSMLSQVKSVSGPYALEEDIPFWFNMIASGGRSLDVAVFDTVDAATLMTYRNVADGSDGISALGRAEFDDGVARGKRVRLAVETNPDPLAKLTFYNTSVTYMAGQLSKVDAAYAASSLYSGIAIDDYLGYRKLPR